MDAERFSRTREPVDPKDETYGYIIYPDAEKAKSINDIPVTVISNDGEAQVIRENATGDLYCVFHTACERAGISVDAPLLVCVKNGEIFVCDATHKLEKATVSFGGKSYETVFDGHATVKL